MPSAVIQRPLVLGAPLGLALALGGAAVPGRATAQGMSMPMPAGHSGMAMPAPKSASPKSGTANGDGQAPSPTAAEPPAAAKDEIDDPPEVSDSDPGAASMAPSSRPQAARQTMPMSPSMSMDIDMKDMDMSGMQGGPPPADARDPDYSDGRRSSHLAEHAHTPGNDAQRGVAFQRAEATLTAGKLGGAWEGEGWYGTDRLRAVFSTEGAAGPDGVSDARNELHVRVPYAAFWNVEAGGRLDAADGSPVRGWAALGVSGIAPYRFRNDAFVYVGDAGRTALRLESTYDFRLNRKWVLFPRIEANVYGRADPALGRGAGLSSGDLGLRLRYEFVPWIAPYVGIETEWLYGGTARLAAEDGQPRIETRGVAGLKFWF